MTTESEPPRDDVQDARPEAPALSFDAVVDRLQHLWPSQDRSGVRLEQVGQFIDRFEIMRLLGSGSFGVVYLAHDAELRRDVALKVPRPEVIVDEEKRKRFEQEAMTASQLDHPGIVPILEAQLRSPTPFLVSSFCPGPNLGEWLVARDEPVPPREGARFVAELARSVHYAHQKGVLHRDLKPANVLLKPVEHLGEGVGQLSDYEPRLTDFGLAKLAESSFADTRSSLLVGTPLYMAPEQLTESAHDQSPAVDVFSLGVILFELLTLQTPFTGTNYLSVVDQLRGATAPAVRQLAPHVSRDLETICAICLEKEPQDRYPTAEDLADDLENVLENRSIVGRRPSTVSRFLAWSKRPQRVREAGIYTALIHTLSVLFFGFCWYGFSHMLDLSAQDYVDTVTQMFAAIMTVHVPMIVIGWMTASGSRWATWLGAACSIPCVLIFVFNLLGWFPSFAAVYRNAEYHRFAFNSLFLILMLVQLALYVIAIIGLNSARVGRRASRRGADMQASVGSE